MLFSVSQRFFHGFSDLRRLLEQRSSASESKMAAGAAAVQMLPTFGSFRHKDASRGPAHFFHGVTGLVQLNFEP